MSAASRLGPFGTSAGAVGLRELRRGDGQQWRRIRIADESSLRAWDVSSPLSWQQRHTPRAWREHRRHLLAARDRGECLVYAITVDDAFAGQLTFGAMTRGALRSGWVGYWVDSRLHGRGVATAALALGIDAYFADGMHRVEATIAPANVASRRVVEHLGFRHEGLLRRYLDIDGDWRDHDLYALTVEDLPEGALTRISRR